VLVNAAMPGSRETKPDPRVLLRFLAFSIPFVGETFLRLRARRMTPEQMVRETLHLCYADRSRMKADVFDAHVELARERRITMPDADAAFLTAARSVVRAVFRRADYHRMVHRVKAPTFLVHGTHDRLVNVAAARAIAALRPDWEAHVFEGVGHTPQLEVPDEFLALLAPFMERHAGGGVRRDEARAEGLRPHSSAAAMPEIVSLKTICGNSRTAMSSCQSPLKRTTGLPRTSV
jgi:pimeloyl-ACP methyl ester carboxylesterase